MMDLQHCDRCRQKVPQHTVQPMTIGREVRDMCAICALKMRNKVHGIPLETPFTGTMAHQIFLDAVAHLGERAPKWAQRVAAMDKAEPHDAKPTGSGGFYATLDASEL